VLAMASAASAFTPSSAFSSINVAARVRPKLAKEEQKEDLWRWQASQIWPAADPARKFTLDRLFPPDQTNELVYANLVAPIIEGVVAGYNGTVFAYGQSGSGKTHTMLGDEGDPGVVRRASQQIFSHFEQECQRRPVQFLIRVSYFEIYQEKIKDLLCDVRRASLHGLATSIYM